MIGGRLVEKCPCRAPMILTNLNKYNWLLNKYGFFTILANVFEEFEYLIFELSRYPQRRLS